MFQLGVNSNPSRLLRSGDAGDEAKRHHGHLVAVMDVADAKNSVDRMFARLGRTKRDALSRVSTISSRATGDARSIEAYVIHAATMGDALSPSCRQCTTVVDLASWLTGPAEIHAGR